MSKVEQLAQEQFNTFRNRLCEILSEIEEEHKSAFIEGYAKGETDEKFRTKQVVTSHIADLEKENAELKAQVEKMKCCQNCKFEDNDCIEEPCSACTRCLGDIKRKGNSDKWEIKEND